MLEQKSFERHFSALVRRYATHCYLTEHTVAFMEHLERTEKRGTKENAANFILTLLPIQVHPVESSPDFLAVPWDNSYHYDLYGFLSSSMKKGAIINIFL